MRTFGLNGIRLQGALLPYDSAPPVVWGAPKDLLVPRPVQKAPDSLQESVGPRNVVLETPPSPASCPDSPTLCPVP